MLQVWLPLDGNLENKGLANVTVINGGATVDNNGKIGKCYSLTTGRYLGLDAPNVNNHKYSPISIALWFYPTQSDSTERNIIGCWESGGCGIYMQNQKIGFSIYVNGYKICIMPSTITLNTWHHICATYDKTIMRLYIDGQEVNSMEVSGNITYNSTCPWLISGNPGSTSWGAGNVVGKLNDIRIYNHVLSPKEVKEISKGLILHYKLDGNDIGITVPRNGGLIPDGVELYDYILSSGTLWIDTGTKANLYPFKLDIEFMSHTSSGEKDVWGNINSSLGDKYGFVSGVNGLTFFQWGGSVWSKTGATVNQWHIVTYEYPDANNRNMIANGTSYTVAISNNNIILSNSNIYLFSDGPRGSMKFNGKIKYAKIYVGNILVRNMLPCTYLGEPGMWDTVENKFYRNQGTGLFTLGNKITLKEYEYLLSSGTQWINTGVNGYMNHKYVLDYQQTGTGSYRVWGVFGQSGYVGYNMSITYSAGRCVRWSSTSSGTNLVDNIDAIANTDRHTFIIDNGLVYYDGVNKGRSDGHSSSCVINYPLYLFTVNPANTTPSANSQVKVYSYKDYDSSNNLIRDMVPVSYNGTPGLWDKVEWKFYANAGTGSFTLGPEKTIQQDAPIFYDSSGYCNHGSITGTLTTNNDSPRYTNSTQFGSNKLVSTTASGPHILTMSIWAKDAGSTPSDGLMFKDHLGDMALGIQSGTLYSGKLGGKGAGNKAISAVGYTANTWHHWVMVNRNNTFYVYMDGQQVLSGTSGSWGAGSITNALHIGGRSGSSSWPGKLSDFRAYVTALSEEDILELYNTSAILTNNGTLEEYEIIEDNLSDITKRGLIETSDFYEEGADDNHPLGTERTRVASNYITSREFIEL